ncbi:MAG: hydrogenase maturation nickel metallochaperone HypA [Verrucomicrobiota bacterium]|jgi:hydrogenase nickel insertion protein HypA
MHEVHLVRAIVDTVEKQAAAQGARRVKHVKIRFNPLTSHSAEHVQFSFEVVKKESALLQGATLALTQVAPLVRCAKCGHQFETDHLPDVCPICDSLDLKAVNCTDMILEGFEIEK